MINETQNMQKAIVVCSVKAKTRNATEEFMARVFDTILKPSIKTMAALGIPEEEYTDQLMEAYAGGVMDGVMSALNKAMEEEEA